jgi:CDP-diacylglycerol--glycerol-3-phosphate 3-phosphatidyltransferase
MASIYDLKPKFQNLLRPIVAELARGGVTPNQVTIAALVLSLATGAVIAWTRGGRALLLLPVVLFARMALNAIDGMLAREYNLKSALGAILNELGDVVADAGLYLPLARVPEFAAGLVVLIVLLGVLSEMTGVLGVQIGASRRYDGPMGKSDRAFLFGLMGLLVGWHAPIVPAIRWVLWGMIVLLVLTIWNRARRAIQEVAKSSPPK